MSRPVQQTRADFLHFTPHQTRFNDNNEFGHLYNVAYMELFDNAVNGWLMHHGMMDFRGDDPIPVVAESGCSYLHEIRYPDAVEIGLRLGRLGNASFTLELGLFKAGENKAAAQARFTMVLVSPKTRSSQPAPPHYRSQLEKLRLPA